MTPNTAITLQIYTPDGGPSKRLDLRTKDQTRAAHVAHVIRRAWQRGDYGDCKERRDRLNQVLDHAPDDYLLPLVNLIGAEYFEGEQVG